MEWVGHTKDPIADTVLAAVCVRVRARLAPAGAYHITHSPGNLTSATCLPHDVRLQDSTCNHRARAFRAPAFRAPSLRSRVVKSVC